MNTIILIIILLLKKLLGLIIEENETNPESCKITVGDIVRITNYMSIFSKSYTKNESEELFVVILC